MAKLTTTDIASINTSTATTINNNFTAVETAMENTLSRDGTTPNTMSADLDMNSQRILNLPDPVASTEPLRLVDLTDFVGGTLQLDAYPQASYVTLGTNSSLTSERVLTAGTGITVTDAGAGSTVTVSLTGNSLTDGDKGDITTSASGATWTIDTGVVTNAKSADMAAYTLKGRNAGTTGVPSDISITALTAKSTLVSGDLFLLSDGAASNAFKKVDATVIAPKSIVMGSCGAGTIAAGATAFISTQLNATEANVSVPVAVAGTFRNLRVVGNNPGGAGETGTFTVRKAGADTSIVAIIVNGTNVASDTSNTSVFAAGDTFCVKGVNTAGGATQSPRFSIEFYPS